MNRREIKIMLGGIIIGALIACLVFLTVNIINREKAVAVIGGTAEISQSAVTESFTEAVTALSAETAVTPTSESDTSPTEKEISPPEVSDITSAEYTAGNTWDKSTVYNGGDEVIYNGKVYRAKWWTQGETPDSSDVWEDTLIAAPTPEATMPTTAEDISPAPPTERPSGIKVVAYYPSWKSDTSKLRYDILTHVIYAFAIPTAEGGLRPLEAAEQVPGIISSAHNSGAKVLLGVGGWSYNDVPLESTFISATETPEKTAAFAAAIVEMCNRYGFDGVDMDWEHPRVDGSSAKQYEALMLLLSEKLHSEGKLLTSAVLSGATADGNIYYDAAAHSDKVLAAVDWINVMAYDGGDGERHSGYDFAVNSALYWRDKRKMPAEKVVLGVPFYSRPGWAAYENILAAVPEAKDSDHVSFNGMEVWYNGQPTIRKKSEFAARELGGIMIWEITQDTSERQSSLLTAIAEGISE